MYLNRQELLNIIDSVVLGCDDNDAPFDKSEQVKTCSVDIRLSNIFWERKKKKNINLGADSFYAISPTRNLRKISLNKDGAIKLKPGDMLLGRTSEKISLPASIVGKITTRSTFARLGIAVTCNCDLINPGYTGHVPLELINTTKTTFIIKPGLPVAQIFLMEINPDGITPYNDESIGSKYDQDEGGPSQWWKDALTKRILSKSLLAKMDDASRIELIEKFTGLGNDAIERFEKYYNDGSFLSSDDLMTRFKASEKKKNIFWKICKFGMPLLLVVTMSPLLFYINQLFNPASQFQVPYYYWPILILMVYGNYCIYQDDRKYFMDD